jgi:hypothetical protein
MINSVYIILSRWVGNIVRLRNYSMFLKSCIVFFFFFVWEYWPHYSWDQLIQTLTMTGTRQHLKPSFILHTCGWATCTCFCLYVLTPVYSKWLRLLSALGICHENVLNAVLFYANLSTKSCTVSKQSSPPFSVNCNKTLLIRNIFQFTPRNVLYWDFTKWMRGSDWLKKSQILPT